MSDERDRIEAAAKACSPVSDGRGYLLIAGTSLAAADAWDREHGYVRIKLDDALVEQVAETLRTTAANGSAGTYDYRLARAVVAALREAAQ